MYDFEGGLHVEETCFRRFAGRYKKTCVFFLADVVAAVMLPGGDVSL